MFYNKATAPEVSFLKGDGVERVSVTWYSFAV